MNTDGIHPNRQQFGLGEVIRAIGAKDSITPAVANNWVGRGHLPHLSQWEEDGARKYSARDVFQFAGLYAITSLKIPAGDASKLTYFFAERSDEMAMGAIPQRGGFSVLLASDGGKLSYQPIWERNLDGEPLQHDFISDLPGFLIINVDRILQAATTELIEILRERGDLGDEQLPADADRDQRDREYLNHQKMILAEKVLALKALETRLESESREPNGDESREADLLSHEITMAIQAIEIQNESKQARHPDNEEPNG